MKVLFVCSGNAHRSPLAEALLKKLRPDLEVDSGGTHIAIPISEKVREYLTKRNAEQYLKKVPEGLYTKQLDEYDLIVAMEQRHKDYVLSRCPECKRKTALWNIEDPYFMDKVDAEKIYEQIRDKVIELAESV
ncbi:MAG: low molecular weight phosphatase family protein [Candidatus Bathyarchaeota archaeon]|nr:low molecular weight phosphatase family protein [Candidatus Bathyarchaeota archaeon]MDH5746905.1 low molecular weight phosphatase family protein [Candidatus Bathyarchaeota archaeon]